MDFTADLLYPGRAATGEPETGRAARDDGGVFAG
jgi:hypothetical protein